MTTNNKSIQQSFTKFRSHGFIKKNHWSYEIENFGFNYRLSDINCALGISQLNKIKKFLIKRKKIFETYKKHLKKLSNVIKTIEFDENNRPSYHLFIIFLKRSNKFQKDNLINFFFKKNIMLQQHYKPLSKFKILEKKISSNFPNANQYYNSAISLPIHFKMKNKDIKNVLKNLELFFKK